MGIDVNSAKFLLWVRQQGVDFVRTLTIGRQGLHLSPAMLRSSLANSGREITPSTMHELFAVDRGFAEPFLKLLGAKEADSLDASGFEGATLVHDMNQRIPQEWRDRYTVVFDGGTLEHVFDFPKALRNCMDMVAVDGHFLAVTPANNYLGHGFYQFSPELFARVFCEANGFRLERMMLFETSGKNRYEVRDPAEVGRRVKLVNRRPTMLAVMARKTSCVDGFQCVPQQSDYVTKWTDGTTTADQEPPTCRESFRHQQPWHRRWMHQIEKWFKPRLSIETLQTNSDLTNVRQHQ